MALIVYNFAQKMLCNIKPIIDQVKRHDRSLADQMQRSAQSTFLNIAEGQSALGKNEVARFTNALCEARETRAALQVAISWCYINKEYGKKSDAELDRIIAMLWGLTHRTSKRK